MQLGAPPDVLQAARNRAKQRDVFNVFPENWPSLEVFFAMATQWNRAGMDGKPCGLNYGALEPVLRMLKVYVPDEQNRRVLACSEWPQIFDDLRVMERIFLDNV